MGRRTVGAPVRSRWACARVVRCGTKRRTPVVLRRRPLSERGDSRFEEGRCELKRPGPARESKEPDPPDGSILWVVWLTYGAFYFCRQNPAAAVPGLQAAFHFDKAHVGLILGGLKFA